MHILEITLQRKVDQSWPVVARHQPGENALALWSRSQLALDLAELDNYLPTDREYGEMLGKALFHDTLRDAFTRALAEAKTAGESLRVLLILEADDLRGLRWEQVCAPFDFGWDYFSLNQQTSYQIYLPSQIERRFPPIGRRDLRALVLVAAPEDLGSDYKLGSFDVAATVESVRAALGEIKCDVLSNLPGSAARPTLDALCDQIIAQPYTLLHIVCHGAFNKANGETILYLPKDDATRAPVKASELITRLNRLNSPRGLPHFTFLSTCESANPQAENGLGGLGQRLVRDLGMPAVLAMTDRIQIKTAQALASAFYTRLREHGEVDRALSESLGSLQGKFDVTVPALFSRLGGRPLFSDSLNRPLTLAEIQYGLGELSRLVAERAPVLSSELAGHTARIQSALGLDSATLGAELRQEYETALTAVNQISGEVLDMSFGALALGKTAPAYDARCPFPGLIAFQPTDKEFFFGREPLVETLQQRLAEHNFLAVLGASGSGKSSLVLAGLVPALGGEMAYFTPSDNPLERMSAALEAAPASALVVADQFEELFTLTTSHEKRLEFIKSLLELAQKRRVVVTMRADFLGEVAPYESIKAEIQKHQEIVAPMNTDELRRAMELQAAKVGLRFEADLTQDILDSVRDEPGAMPLLQHAMLLLWNRRHGRWLRTEEYRAIGGVQKAIAGTADELYTRLEMVDRERMRNIFVRLTVVDDVSGGSARDTRRRVNMQELIPAGDDPAPTVALVARLADARLLVTGENASTDQQDVEVAHEALIRYWPRLRHWLDEDRSNLRLRETIRESALEWESNKTDESFIEHRGVRLEEAEKLSQLPRFRPNALEQAYLDACVKLREDTRKQAERRRRITLGVSLVATIIMAVLGAYGFIQGQVATQQKNVAVTQEAMAQAKATEAFYAQSTAEAASQNAETARVLAEQKQKEAESQSRNATAGQLALQSKSVAEDYPMRSLLLALEAVYINKNAGEPVLPEAEAALRAANETVTGMGLPGFRRQVSGIAFSPDSQWMLAASHTGEVKIWDMNQVAGSTSIAPTFEKDFGDNVTDFVFVKEDGHWVGVSQLEKTYLWSDSSSKRYGEGLTLDGYWCDLPGEIDRLITSTETQTFVWTLDPVKQSIVSRQVFDGTILFVGAKNRFIVTYSEGKGALLWELSPQALPVEPSPLDAAKVTIDRESPDGSWLLGYSDTDTFIWNIDPSGAKVTGKQALAGAFRFVDGENRYLVTYSPEQGSLLWRLPLGSGQPQPQVLSATMDVLSLETSPDSRLVIFNSYQSANMLIWPLDQDGIPGKGILLSDTSAYSNYAISNDSRWLVMNNSVTGKTELWDLADLEQPKQITLPVSYQFVAGTFSEDGKWLVLVSSNEIGFLPVSDNIPTYYRYTFSSERDEGVYMAEFAKKQQMLGVDFASSYQSGHIFFNLALENPAAYTIAETPDVFKPAAAVEEAGQPASRWIIPEPDGDYPTLRIKDSRCQSCAAPLALTGPEAFVVLHTISPDGKWLAGGTEDGNLRLWNMEELPGQRQYSGDMPVTYRFFSRSYMAFSPDNQWMATGNLLWRLVDGHAQGAPIQLSDRAGMLAVFSQDSRWMVFVKDSSTEEEGSVTVYLLDMQKMNQGDLPTFIPLEIDKAQLPEIIAFSPDSRWIAISGQSTVGPDGQKSVESYTWNIADPENIQRYALGQDVFEIAFTAGSRSLVVTAGAGVRETAYYTNISVAQWKLPEDGSAPTQAASYEMRGSNWGTHISTNGRWLYCDDDGMLWDLEKTFSSGTPSKFQVAAPGYVTDNDFWISSTGTFSPGDHQLVLKLENADFTGYTHTIFDLKPYEDGQAAQPVEWGTYKAPDYYLLWGSPGGNWLVYSGMSQGIGIGGTVSWVGVNYVTSSLNGRGYILWWGGGGGGGGLGSFKTDFAATLMQTHAKPAGDSPRVVALRGHETQVQSMIFSPDEKWVVTIPDQQESLRLWDTATMWASPDTRPVLLPFLAGSLKSIGFTADSRWLVLVTDDNLVHFWSTNIDELISQACQVVGRNFIINEWERYFPGQAYRQTCPNLPAHPSTLMASP